MFKKFKSILPVLLLVIVLLLPCFALATDNPSDKLKSVADSSGYETKDKKVALPTVIGGIIKVVISILGVVFLGLIVYAGFIWMIAAGNEEKITRAKDTMKRAIIGLIIVVASYAISQFVVYSILSR